MKLITLIYVLLLFIIFVPNFLLKFPKIQVPFLNLLCSFLFSIIFYITFDLVNETYLKEGHQDPKITINNNRSVGMDKDSTIAYYQNIINGLVENQDDLIAQEQAKMESLKQEKEQQMAAINEEIQEIEQEKQDSQDASATALLEEQEKCLKEKNELIEKHGEEVTDIGISHNATVVGLQQNINTLTGEKSTLQTNYNTLQKANSTLQTDYDTLQTEKATLQTDYNTLETNKNIDIGNLQSQINDKNDDIEDLSSEKGELQANYSELQDAYDDLEGEQSPCAGRSDLYTRKYYTWPWWKSGWKPDKNIKC